MKRILRRVRLVRLFALGAFGLALLLLPAPPAHANPAPPVQPEEVGLAASSALLQFTSQGHVLGFQVGGFYISNATYALRVELVGANPVAPASDTDSQSEQRGAPPLGRVTYPNLWDGITLTLDSARGGVVSSSYQMEAGADPRSIRLRYNAPVTINSDGTLTIAYATGEMCESAPLAWQELAGQRVPVAVSFSILGEREVGFALGDYDAGQPLFIDPTLTWNTFLGGGGDDFGSSIAVDNAGNVYIAGTSDAGWGLPKRDYTSDDDAFAAKLNSAGVLQWNTFMGASGRDNGYAVAVDNAGNVYVAGYSTSSWQGANPAVRAHSGYSDGFVAKLNSSGVLTWNSFLGGGGTDWGAAIAVDNGGNVYVAGTSDTTWGAPKRAYTDSYDGFAAKLDSNGALTWTTFLGGTSTDYGWGVAVDGSQNVYVVGNSDASWKGTTAPVRAFSGGTDAYAAKLDSSGVVAWNTFLGGPYYDSGVGIAVDGGGNVYVAGDSSTTWQGTNPPVRAYTGSYDAFVAKLNSSGAVTWNTFLGGGGPDYGDAIVRDGNGNLYVAGFSYATWQGTNPPVRSYTGGYDGFAAKLNSNGALTWNTFLGGSANDEGHGIAVDGSGNVHVVGFSGSAWQGASPPVRPYSGGNDAFAVKLNSSGGLTWNAFFSGVAYDGGAAIAIDISGNVYVAGFSNASWDSPLRGYTSGYDGFAAKLNPGGVLAWHIFLGGSGQDYASSIAVDGSGNVYVGGYSNASWGSPQRGYTNGYDGFVAKLISSGGIATLTWNTFLGGGGQDIVNAIAIDGSGNVCVAGQSTSTWGAPIRGHSGGGLDAYAAKVSPSGTLGWNSFLGGIGWDTGAAVAADSIGNVYVAGASNATWQGLWSVPVRAYTGGTDAFAVKVNPGGAVVWNTFLGGTGYDDGSAIALDGGGSVYVAGYSSATWQGSSSPVRVYGGGNDAFAAKVNSNGGLVWNSFLGGSGNDFGFGVAVDAIGNVYATGYSSATWGSPVRAFTSAQDGFAAKMSPSGSLKWNTFLGGSGNDYGYAVAVDGRENVFVAGDSSAAWQGAGAPRRAYLNGTDAFVATIVAFDGYLPLIRK